MPHNQLCGILKETGSAIMDAVILLLKEVCVGLLMPFFVYMQRIAVNDVQ